MIYGGKAIDFVDRLDEYDVLSYSLPIFPNSLLIALRYYLMDESDLKIMYGSADEGVLHRLPTDLEAPIDATNEYKVLSYLSNAVKEQILVRKSREFPSLESNLTSFEHAKKGILTKRDSQEIWQLAGLTYAVTDQAAWRATDVCLDLSIEKLRKKIFL